ncbi:hypothetical protein Hanom_Chr10g00896531 [Helianthus anomalus]
MSPSRPLARSPTPVKGRFVSLPAKQDSQSLKESCPVDSRIPLDWSHFMRALLMWPSLQCHRKVSLIPTLLRLER